MFDRIRPPEADAGGTIIGYAPPGTTRPADPAKPAELHTCGHCGARVQELRRGRCWGCYQAWSGLRPVGKGARCLVCSERRSDALRLAEVHGRWLPFCHGCATRASRLSPLPYTVEGLRRALSRERRWDDRRLGEMDVRVFPRDRRSTDRRQDSAREAATAPDELGDFVLDVEVVEPEVMEETTVEVVAAPAGQAIAMEAGAKL